MRWRALLTTSLAAAVSLAAASAAAGPVRPGDTDVLGVYGRGVPEILEKAKTDPYAPPADPVCTALPAELDALNEALGPDADQAKAKQNTAGKYLGRAVRGLIPHRDVIRFLTGAGKREDRLRDAAMAGWARRGYLKGLAKTLDCTSGDKVAAGGGPPLAAPAPHPDLLVPPAHLELAAEHGPEPRLTPATASDSAVQAAAVGTPPVNP